MALLSIDMIREIRGVADAYAARERARPVTPVQERDARSVEQRRPDGDADHRR